MKNLKAIGLAIGLSIALAFSAHAQQTKTSLVVTTCGTLPPGITYAVGQFNYQTVDLNGNVCGGGGGGGSVTQGTSPWVVAGPAASGAALSGNPVRIGMSDGTNTQNWLAAIALADGVNGNNTGAVVGWLYNGATFDRARGDATNGAWVNVKTSVLPTGAATAAFQGTNSATTAHTCSTAGYSQLGCLGQIDDDVKASIAAGSAIIGKVGIDQTTPGITNGFDLSSSVGVALGAMANYGTSPGAVKALGVNAFATNLGTTTNAGAAVVKGGVGTVNGGSTYQTIAASQTAQVLQTATGATGDYLSHCVVTPTTTTPGNFIILDNAVSITLFAGGASSVSNLVPFSIPIGAVSVSGAWKATTGANMTAICFGKFS